MATSVFNAPHFQNEEAAFAYVEHSCGRMARFALIAAMRVEAHPQDGRQDHPPRPLQVLRLPEALHREMGPSSKARTCRCISGFKSSI